MKYLVYCLSMVCTITNVFAFESEAWQTKNFTNDIINTKENKTANYFYYTNEQVNYPKYMNKQRYTLPEVNVAGVRVHDGVMDITDSSHMFFTFDGAVFIIDY